MVYTIYNRFLAQKGLLRLCENVAAERTYKIYQNTRKGLHNLYKFFARRGLFRLCENMADERDYEIYYNGCKGLLNQ